MNTTTVRLSSLEPGRFFYKIDVGMNPPCRLMRFIDAVWAEYEVHLFGEILIGECYSDMMVGITPKPVTQPTALEEVQAS